MSSASLLRYAPPALCALLTLFLPAPWQGLPLILSALAAAWGLTASDEASVEDDPFATDSPSPDDCEGLLIDPHSLTDGQVWQAQVWMGAQPVDGARLRSLPGAPLFSAACALTETETLALTGCAAKDLRAWQTAIGIRPQRLQAQFPRVEEAKLGDFRGVIVRDGAEERAYFVGNPMLMSACTLTLDERGHQRPLLAGDRKRAATLPPDLICYATSLVSEGKLSGLTWLGGARPFTQWTARAEEIAKAQDLSQLIPLYYDAQAEEAEEIAAALLPSLLPAREGQKLLRLEPSGVASASDIPDPDLIEDWRSRHRHHRFRALALYAASLSAALPAALALIFGNGGVLMGLAALLCCLLPSLGFWLCAGSPLRSRKHFPTATRLALSLLPTLVISLALGLLSGAVAVAALSCAALAAAWLVGGLGALFFPASIREEEDRKHAELIILAGSGLALLLLLLALWGQSISLLGLLLGLVLGLGCALLRQLIAPV